MDLNSNSVLKNLKWMEEKNIVMPWPTQRDALVLHDFFCLHSLSFLICSVKVSSYFFTTMMSSKSSKVPCHMKCFDESDPHANIFHKKWSIAIFQHCEFLLFANI